MSKTIDQRVVEMQFDNKHFESNVSTTLSTLDKLKKSLNFTGASKGLEDVSTAARRCDISVVGNAAEKVGLKFDAMYTMADQALRNITNSAMNYGKRIVSALTIDPIKTGFSEYETQINAVQTILANTESKGKTLDDVNSALDELNTYADKTIYNFTEMTRNIGTFTAAGVDLDTSVAAIKGIANLAAVSGSTSQQASTAMYQLSQAMASGTVKLMDWNSVVNAGMGGQIFQDALKETAKVHGIAIDDIIAKQGSFRESLSEGWLTTEILTDTLSKFTGDLSEEQLKSQGYTEEQIKEIMKLGQTANDAATKVKTFTQLFDTLKEAAQSGWTQTWEILVGDFEEAKELLTQISDVIGGVIGESAEARNELLENWKVLGGREDLIESFKNIFEAIVSVITPIKEAFREIFPPMTAERLVAITKGLKEFTAKLKLSEKGSENLKRTFAGLFAVVSIVAKVFSAAFKAIKILFGGVDDLGGGILGITAAIGDFLVFFAEIVKRGNIVESVFKGIAHAVNFVVKVIGWALSGVGDLFGFIGNSFAFPGIAVLVESLGSVFDGMLNVGDSAKDMKNKVTNALTDMGDAFKNNPISKFFTSIWKGITVVATAISKAFRNIAGGLLDRLANADIMGILDIINGIISGGIGIALIKFIRSFGDSFGGISDILGSFNDVLGSLSGALKGFQNEMNASALMKIAGAIAILAAAILVLSFIDSEKLTDSLAAITILFAGLMSTIAMVAKLGGVINVAGMVAGMLGLSIGILLLASAVKKLSTLDVEEVGIGLSSIVIMMFAMAGAIKLLGGSKIEASAIKMIAMVAAVKILADVVLDLSSMSWEEMGVGLIAMGVSLTLLVGAMIALSLWSNDDMSKSLYKFIAQMTAVATAAKILGNAVLDLSTMSWEEMKVGLISMTVVMGLLVGAMVVMGHIRDYHSVDKSGMTSSATAFVGMAIAMLSIAAAIRIMMPAIRELGNMSWKELGKAGVVLSALLGALAIFSLEIKMVNPANLQAAGTSILAVSVGLLILSSAFKAFGNMSWESLGKAGSVLAAIVGAIALLALDSKLVNPGSINAMAASLVIVAVALQMLVPPLMILSLMSWESLGKAGVAIAGIVAALALLGAISRYANPGTIATVAASLAILAVSLRLLIVPLALFGAMSWSTIAKGAVVVAGAFVILGLAALILKPLTPTIVTLCGALALLGVGMLAVGIGATLLGGGLASLSAGFLALASSLSSVVITLIMLLPKIIQKFAEGIGLAIVAISTAIADGAPALGEAITALVLMMCDVLLECAPALIETTLELIVGLLESLGKFTPQIVDSLFAVLLSVLEGLQKYAPALVDVLFGIIIAILDGISSKIPDLIQAFVDIFMSVFSGFVDALKSIDPDILIEGLLSVGLMAGIMLALAAVASLIPQAMIGVLGMGAVVAELALVLGAIGLLAQIPGLSWIVSEGGNFLQTVGTAIGQFIGGITGGIAKGFASSLPDIGTSMSEFMTNIQPFIDGAKLIDASVMTGVSTLAKVILAITASNIVNALFGFGGLSLVLFGKELVGFGHTLVEFSDVIDGVSTENIVYAAEATEALADMANHVPNSGGIVALLVGENSIARFGSELIALGVGLKGFSLAISGIDTAAMMSASDATLALAEMSNHIPNTGGLVSLITGDNSVARFGGDLIALGIGLAGFSMAVSGINTENMVDAAGAAKALAEMSNHIPNSGGIVSWFTGDNSVARFGGDLIALGIGLAGFSFAISGINVEAMLDAVKASEALVTMTQQIPDTGGVWSWLVGDTSISKFSAELIALGIGLAGFSATVSGVNPENMVAAAAAGKALAEMTQQIPDTSGVFAWFTGGNSIAKFGVELTALGKGLKGFSDAIVGINPTAMTAAALAGKALAEMTSYIPVSGGIISWFAGDNSVSKFANELPKLGAGLKGFSDSTIGINPETMTAAASAAESLAKLVAVIPDKNGIEAWFTGATSVKSFAGELPVLGRGLKAFSDSVVGVNPESMTVASDSAKTLAQMMDTLPNQNGIAAWFTGESNVTSFAYKLPTLGKGLKDFSVAVTGINPENITAAANAAKALAEMTASIPKEGGIKAWFTGETSVSNFSSKLPTLGKGLKGFSDSVEGINPENLKAAADAGKTLAEMTETTPKDTGKLVTFGDNLVEFGEKLTSYFHKTAGITSESTSASSNALKAIKDITDLDNSKLKSVSSGIDGVAKSIQNLAKVPKDSLRSFKSSLEDLGETGVKAFVKAFDKIDDEMKDAGADAITGFKNGANNKKKSATDAFERIADACEDAISDKKSKFRTAGKDLVQGFADGISANSYKAEAQAKAMAEAAVEAAREALKINSPSKVFRAMGYSIPEGLAIGIDKMSGMVTESSESMAFRSIDTVKRGISRIADLVNSDIDSQPTIRPVLDLSDVRSGASAIGNMLKLGPSIGVSANVGAISSAMAKRNQNGVNDDVVSAIEGLAKVVGNGGNTVYNIDGITYDDGSGIADAVKSIVRAARIERRM